LARNQMFFHEELPKWNLVFELIFYHFFLWLKSVDKNFTYTSLIQAYTYLEV
jgi:hypothetical protein